MIEKQELKFPVAWNYKIIVADDNQEEAEKEVAAILKKNGIVSPLIKGNASKNGKFITLKVTVAFNNKESMDSLSKELSEAKHVKFIL